MTVAAGAKRARSAAIALWFALTLSFLGWIAVGYSLLLCGAAMLILLIPIGGMCRGARRTYAWATMFALPYLVFAVTELLVNPVARIPASLTVLLLLAWVVSLIAYLRISRPRG
jgi:uncharacterized membrane protein